MKHHINRWMKFKEKALSRNRQALSRGRQGPLTREHHTQVLLLALCNYLESSGQLESDNPNASILVESIHDYKEHLRGNS